MMSRYLPPPSPPTRPTNPPADFNHEDCHVSASSYHSDEPPPYSPRGRQADRLPHYHEPPVTYSRAARDGTMQLRDLVPTMQAMSDAMGRGGRQGLMDEYAQGPRGRRNVDDLAGELERMQVRGRPATRREGAVREKSRGH